MSLRATARRAGVSAMAPYRHFADKDALLAGIATIGFERLATALRAADAVRDPREALIAQGIAYVAFAAANPGLFRLMFGATAAHREAPLASAADAAHAVLAARVATLAPPAMAGALTLACWSLVHGLAMLGLDGMLAGLGAPAADLAAGVLSLLAASGMAEVGTNAKSG